MNPTSAHGTALEPVTSSARVGVVAGSAWRAVLLEWSAGAGTAFLCIESRSAAHTNGRMKRWIALGLVVTALVGGACDEPPACVDCADAGIGGKAEDLPAPEAPPAGTPVEVHGPLQVVGTQLTDRSAAPVHLKGISTMWLHWEVRGYAQSLEGLQWMRDNWGVQVIRAAMGVEASGGYATRAASNARELRAVVENAIRLGLYVIIDWHAHEAFETRELAESFFQTMAQDYGQYPNVIYEVFNEPLKVDWATELKPYHEALVAKIRETDPDNVIVLGTPQWSQRVGDAAADPVAGTNLMYTLHFYACTHDAWLREDAADALANGLPLFVTEWGATHADGGLDGVVCDEEAQLWHTFLNENQISWTAWKLDGCSDASCLLKTGAPVRGGWTDEWLHGHGPFVRDRLLE